MAAAPVGARAVGTAGGADHGRLWWIPCRRGGRRASCCVVGGARAGRALARGARAEPRAEDRRGRPARVTRGVGVADGGDRSSCCSSSSVSISPSGARSPPCRASSRSRSSDRPPVVVGGRSTRHVAAATGSPPRTRSTSRSAGRSSCSSCARPTSSTASGCRTSHGKKDLIPGYTNSALAPGRHAGRLPRPVRRVLRACSTRRWRSLVDRRAAATASSGG